ncbi:MAG: SH3 domain-containing protein [Caldilineaceae bacterium]
MVGSLQRTQISWIYRLALLLLFGAITTTTSGCSLIMGLFGPETATTDLGQNVAPVRVLVPTPTSTTLRIAAALPRPASAQTPSQATPQRLTQTASTPATAQAHRTVTITGSSVNLRNGPGLDAAIVRTVPAATTYDYIDTNSSGDWYQLCCIDGQLAWVFAELAKLGAADTAPQPTGGAAPASSFTLPPAAQAQATNPFTANTDASTLADESFAQAVAVVQQLATGEMRYVFSDQGFAITLLAAWQALDLSSTELSAELAAFTNQNPGAAGVVEQQLQTLANSRFTFFAAELSPQIVTTGYAANVSVLKQPLPPGITLDLFSRITAKGINERFALATPVEVAPAALPAGNSVLLTYQLTAASTTALGQPLAVTQYLVMDGSTVYAITFTATAAQAAGYDATFVDIAQSFELLH